MQEFARHGRSFAAIVLLLPALLWPSNSAPVGVGSSTVAASHAVIAERGPGPGDQNPLLYDAVLESERAPVLAATAGWLSRYRIDAVLSPATADEPARVSGQLDVQFVNDSDVAMPELYFRLYANDPAYDPGEMTVSEERVAGEPVRSEKSIHGTVLRIPLPKPVEAGAAVDVRLAFETVVPNQPRDSYGILAVQPAVGTHALAHWFPLLAGRDANGWLLSPVSQNGDPIFSNTSLFDVYLTAPTSLVIITTGIAIAEEPVGDQVRRRYVSGPVRDFTVVADDDFTLLTEEVAGTRVSSYFAPEKAEWGAAILAYAVSALTVFGDRFGKYPYRELDLVQVKLQGAGGVEFPQLIYIGDDLYGGWSSPNPRFLEFVTAHEVAHQWWYGLVGNNQYLYAFIDEGLAEYCSSEMYFGIVDSPATARRQLDLETKLWYLTALFTLGDSEVDQPTDEFRSSAMYGAIVYGKGALGFAAIRAEIGDDAFFAALRDYADRFRFGIATPDELRSSFERAAGRDLAQIWNHWFEQEAGLRDFSQADLDQLRIELGLDPPD